jgi:transcriptional regulator with GAF, ATPase, and Fis domain
LDDVPLLVEHFVESYRRRNGGAIRRIGAGVVEQLQQHRWPGNVRELQNVIERALIMSTGDELLLDEWPPRRRGEGSPANKEAGRALNPQFVTIATMKQRERENLLLALDAADWRVSGKGGAAELLGTKPSTLQSQIKVLGLSRSR